MVPTTRTVAHTSYTHDAHAQRAAARHAHGIDLQSYEVSPPSSSIACVCERDRPSNMSDDAQPDVLPEDIFLGTTNYTVSMLGAGRKPV